MYKSLGGFTNNVVNIKKLHSATAIVNVTKKSFFVQGHFPGQPVMPGVLIVEAFGQAAAALTANGLDKATYDNPRVYQEGIIHVFVDGDFAVKDGKPPDLRAGKVAKRS